MLGLIAKRLYLCLGQTGQTISEYVVVVALVLAAITAMQVYVQRGLQARYHDFSVGLIKKMRDTTGDQGLLTQYEPYYVFSNAQIYHGSAIQEKIFGGGVVSRQTSDLVKRNATQAALPSCVASEAGCPEGGPGDPGGSCAMEWQDCSAMPCCSENNFCTGSQCVPCGHAGADCASQACCSGFYCDFPGNTCQPN